MLTVVKNIWVKILKQKVLVSINRDFHKAVVFHYSSHSWLLQYELTEERTSHPAKSGTDKYPCQNLFFSKRNQ